MSIQTQIARIKANISDSYDAVSELGVTMPQEKNSDNLASTVRTFTLDSELTEQDALISQILAVLQRKAGGR